MASPNTKRDVSKGGDDLYITPPVALESFYEQYRSVIDQFNVFLDPCDGLGAISNFLESKGKKVYRYDLVDYTGRLDKVTNFLELEDIPEDVECIIFNPPFKLTKEFVDKALSLCSNLLMFNRMTTIESNGRASKFDSKEWDLKSMYQFGFRVSCPKGVIDESGDIRLEPTANSVAYSWFEFDQNNMGLTSRLMWIV